MIIDLEDAVAPSVRADVFGEVTDWLDENMPASVEVWVRVPLDSDSELVGGVLEMGPTGLMLPKASDAMQVESFLDGFPGTRAIVIIETARCLQAVDEVAHVDAVVRLMSGEIDMAADLGVDRSSEAAMAPIRSRIVTASAAAGLPGPLASVEPDYTDLTSLETRGRALRAQGFRAGTAIHPNQIEPLVRAYAPTAEELSNARQMIADYEAALAVGKGAGVDHRGQMMDEATVKEARRLLREEGEPV